MRRKRRLFLAPVLVLSMVAGADTWDILDTAQPHTDVEFTVSEGTWMSVEVSPDGKTLVFDLLGDIYRLSAEGGEATLLFGGPALQRSPVYSPDGRKLLFLSDLSGSDNVWTSNADGSDPKKVTSETVDMLMGPSWGPQGRSIVAAKIDATYPRMYASEIRWFDLAGGAGRVLVETPANKRDVQEPAFSPDGRYLYYTERLTSEFVYVDGNHINYAIKRRELETGMTEELLKGYGGATTAQVSRDGKRIAFVRRVMSKTVLFVYDIATREQRPVYDNLDRDDQTDFVPQGAYYPHFGWFPDNRHVAIWGKGKLYRIDMDTGASVEIPFKLTTRHRITTPVRVAHDLAPARFTVRIVRHLAPKQDGSGLVFTALGHLWQKTLPAGTPTRLTSAAAFEFEPAFSPDGKRLAYVEWDDEKGSTLKVSAPNGRGGRALVSSRGIIRQPAFSRDGKRLVYRIQNGDKSMGGSRAKPGIYWIETAGGEPHFVAFGDDAPQFSPDGSRIYCTVFERGPRGPFHRLQSVTLEGHDRRVHAETADADTRELRVSPDLNWIAFKERQQYFVLPYRETGAPLIVRARLDSVPVAALTNVGGYSLTWSADSTTLHWTLGPDLYAATVSTLFDADRPRPPSPVLPAPYASIGLEVPADAPSGSVAFRNARIITMRGEEVIERGTVVVSRNRIEAVGPVDQVVIPPGAKTIDVTGKTLMPGLFDMHGHIDCCYDTGVTPQKQPSRYAALAFGVTTNFDPYSTDLSQYESVEMGLAGLSVSPRWLGSGIVIYGRSQKPDFTYVPIDSYEDAVKVMQRKLAVGGTYVKSYKMPARRQRQQLVKAGREAGIMVDVEGESHFHNNITMVLDGHTKLEHNLPVANLYDDVVQLMGKARLANSPTLIVTFGELMGENYSYQTTRAWEDPKIKKYVHDVNGYYSPLLGLRDAPLWARAMTTIHVADEIYDIGFRSVARSVKKLDDAGALISAGSHGQVAGLALHWEMSTLR